MSIAARRAEIAEGISEALDDIKVFPYKPSSPAPFTGWIEIPQIDQEEVVFGTEVRLTVECLILVAADRSDFEVMQDKLAVDLILAVTAIGGRATVVQPFTEEVSRKTFFALSARFITESEA